VPHSCGRITQWRAWESVRREVYSSLARAWKSTNVVVGATFLLGSKAPVHRKHGNFTVLPAFFSARNLTAEAGKQGHWGRILRSHGFDLRRYGGEGKTASSGLRDPSRRGPNPFPGPLFALSTQRRIVPRQILAKSRVGLRCETAQQRFLEEFPRACGLAIPATPTFAAQLEIETPARPDLPGRASTLSFRRTAG